MDEHTKAGAGGGGVGERGYEPVCTLGAGGAGECLAQRLLALHEAEREQLASNLHDGIGQQLAALKFRLDDINYRIADRLSAEERRLLEVLPVRVAGMIEETRRIAMHLRPPMLDDLGLLPAIDWLCDEVRDARRSLAVRHELRAVESDIPDALRVVVFRILQEACNNACKYSQATDLEILFETDAEGIRLTITDNGVGFDAEAVNRAGRGFGLRSMRERARLAGGRLQVASTLGHGTRVYAEWPPRTTDQG